MWGIYLRLLQQSKAWPQSAAERSYPTSKVRGSGRDAATMWSTGKGTGTAVQYSCLENPMLVLLLLLSCFSHVRFLRPHRRQPTRFPRPWDSLGKNTGVGCHYHTRAHLNLNQNLTNSDLIHTHSKAKLRHSNSRKVNVSTKSMDKSYLYKNKQQ